MEFGVWSFPNTGACAEDQTATPQAGKVLYEQQCARCHGFDGKGTGSDAKRIFPKPRNLTSGVYKFRSTESGSLPLDEDLFGTISRGLPGSAMPAFEEFSEAELKQLVDYIKSFSQSFTEKKPRPVAMGFDPGIANADFEKGKQLYNDLGCLACHGALGRANGPSAKGLVDDQGRPIRAANLTQRWTYRGGRDPSSIVARMLTGIDGTPMPSYAEAMPAEDFWHLAYYVHSLQEEPHWNTVVRAASSGSLPKSTADPVWSTIESTTVSLGSFIYKDGSVVPMTVNAVSIQSLYNDQEFVLRLIWDDPTKDPIEERTTPPDALGLVLKPEGIGDIGSLTVWPLTRSPALDVIYWSAESNQIRRGVSVGFAPVATGKIPTEILQGEATYEEGRWSLLIRRPLIPTRSVVFAMAIWDGGNGEERRVHSSSLWLELALQ
ncbi:MAG: c-type cytochrome [Candidatus Omnitrophica bacterium]|nr:c-type cytochrome [Candidatus Omnitrophota bacterium]